MNKKLFEEIQERLGLLEKRVARIAAEIAALSKAAQRRGELEKEAEALGIVDFLGLPDHLRLSLMKLVLLREGTVEEVAQETGRVRNLESTYLNQLVRLGFATKKRRGRKTVFRVQEQLFKEILPIVKDLNDRF